MPELPEVEAWRRALDPEVLAERDREGRAGAHRDAEDVRPAAGGARGRAARRAPRRRAKRLLFPTEDDGPVLMVHLMSAGRIRYVAPGEKSPKSPRAPAALRRRRRARPHGGRPQEARGRLADARPARSKRSSRTSGPRRTRSLPETLAPILAGRLTTAPLAAPRPARDRRDRAGLGERDPQRRATLAVRAVDVARRRGDRAARGVRSAASSSAASSCGWPGRANPAVYRVHDRLGEPCPNCRHPARAGRLRGAHDLLLPHLPDRRAGPRRPAHVEAAAVSLGLTEAPM